MWCDQSWCIGLLKNGWGIEGSLYHPLTINHMEILKMMYKDQKDLEKLLG